MIKSVFYLWICLLAFDFFWIFLAFVFCRFCKITFHPRNNGQWPPTSKDFYPRWYPLHFVLSLFFRKSQYFPFLMFSDKRGNWYHFIPSLVWRGPWLGIEPWTSRTRSHRSTNRLSRKRCLRFMIEKNSQLNSGHKERLTKKATPEKQNGTGILLV